MSKNLKISFFLLLITVLPLLSTSFIGILLHQYSSRFISATYLDWFFYSLIFTLMAACALLTPTLMAIILGYYIGYLSIPYLIFINLGAIFLVYTIVKKSNTIWFHDLVKGKKAAIDLLQKIKKNEIQVIFFTKISPVLPFTLTNICFGLSGASLRNILLGGFTGMLPRTIMAVVAGIQSKNIQQLLNGGKSNEYTQLLIGGLIIFSLLGLIQILKK